MLTFQSMVQTIVLLTLLTDNWDSRTTLATLNPTSIGIDWFIGGGSRFRTSSRDVLFHPDIGIFAFPDRNRFVAEWTHGYTLVLLCSLMLVWTCMLVYFPMVLTSGSKEGLAKVARFD